MVEKTHKQIYGPLLRKNYVKIVQRDKRSYKLYKTVF